jgi:NAD(P)-dependent dehydrogenase (short-subunit alcohol dehydrogenase family)
MSGDNERPFADRICLVTGASRGIGAALARRLGAGGAKLVLLARTVGGLEEVDDAIREAGGEPAVLVPHDLREHDGLDRLGASLYERFGHLDMLLGCAAELGPLSPLGHVKPETWAEVFAINVTANFRLLRSLDPLLRCSPGGIAVFLTDQAAEAHRAYWGPYAATKAALEATVLTYAAEVAKTDVRVDLLRPGPTRTALRAAAFPGESSDSLASADSVAEAIVNFLSSPEIPTGKIIDISPAS